MTVQAQNHETETTSIDSDAYAERILSLCEFDLSEGQIFTRPVDNDLVAKVMSFSQAVYSV